MQSILTHNFTPQLQKLLKQFLQGKSLSTQKAYEQDLEDFRKYQGTEALAEALGDFFSSPPGQANLKAMHYRHLLGLRGLKASSINRRLSMLRALTKAAKRMELITWTLELGNLPTTAKAPLQSTDRLELKRVLQWMESQADLPMHRRDRVILLLIHELALKNQEVSDFQLDDLNLITANLQGKGKKHLLTPRLGLAMAAWIEVRGVEPGALLSNFDHAAKAKGLSTTSIYRIIKAMGQAAGVDLNPRSLRQGVILKKVKNRAQTTKQLNKLMKFSGLKHPKSLQSYLPPKERG